MAVDWNADGMLMWKEEAIKEQQECFDLLGTPMWREIQPSQYGDLKREIGFALFGVPEEEPCANVNDGTGYTDKKLKHINKIFDIIKKCMEHHRNPKNICVSFLFMFGKTGDDCITVPVIRIPQFDINFMIASQFLSYEFLSLISILNRIFIFSSIHVVEYMRVGKIIWKVIQYRSVCFAFQEMVCTQQ